MLQLGRRNSEVGCRGVQKDRKRLCLEEGLLHDTSPPFSVSAERSVPVDGIEGPHFRAWREGDTANRDCLSPDRQTARCDFFITNAHSIPECVTSILLYLRAARTVFENIDMAKA